MHQEASRSNEFSEEGCNFIKLLKLSSLPVFLAEEDERAYFLKTQAERKQRFTKGKKGMKQRGRDKVHVKV